MESRLEPSVSVVDLIVKRRKEILETCRSFGATNVPGFGSCARDDCNHASDITLLVDFPDGYEFGTISELFDLLETSLVRKVDLGTEYLLRPRVKNNVLREAIALWASPKALGLGE